MRVVILYHVHSEHGGVVADFAREFENYKRKKVELVDLETVKGADLQSLYGVDQYPAVLVMSDNGSLIRLWQGLPLPLMDELSYYIQDTPGTLAHTAKTIMPLHPTSALS